MEERKKETKTIEEIEEEIIDTRNVESALEYGKVEKAQRALES